MKGLIGFYIMFVATLSYGDIVKESIGESKLECDTMYYHSYYQDGLFDIFPYISPYWVFVRFTPGPADTSPACSLYKVLGWYRHWNGPTCAYPCTVVVWRDEPSPANLILHYIFYEPDNGGGATILEGGLPAPLFAGQDIWMGRCGVGDSVGGDTTYHMVDQTISSVPDRNFYSSTGRYGTRVQLSTWQNYDLCFDIHICCEKPSWVEESAYAAPYLRVYPNIFSGDGISFSYKIASQSTLKIYGLDGRLIGSKLLAPGENKLLWHIMLPSGIYFYKLPTEEKTFCGKFLIF